MRQLHQDAAFRHRALQGLQRGRDRRHWREESVLRALRDFHERTGRWPRQEDMNTVNGLPSYGTVRRAFGSLPHAVSLAGSQPG